ncbi:MAG: hypothetical protein U1E76_01815 [Planctomycetota bacterium]
MPVIAVVVRCGALALCAEMILGLSGLLFGHSWGAQVAIAAGLLGALGIAHRWRPRGRMAGGLLLVTLAGLLAASHHAARLLAVIPPGAWLDVPAAAVLALVVGVGPACVARRVEPAAAPVVIGVALGIALCALLPLWLAAGLLAVLSLLGTRPDGEAPARWRDWLPASALAGFACVLLPCAYQHVSAAPRAALISTLTIAACVLLGALAAQLLPVARARLAAPLVIAAGAAASCYALHGAARGALASLELELSSRAPPALVGAFATVFCLGALTSSIGLAFGWLAQRSPAPLIGPAVGLIAGAELAALLTPALAPRLLLQPRLDHVSLSAASPRGLLAEVERPREPAGFMRWRGSRVTRGAAAFEAEPWKWRLLHLLDADLPPPSVVGTMRPQRLPSLEQQPMFVDLLDLERSDPPHPAASWLAHVVRDAGQFVVLADSPTVFAPLAELLTSEVFAAAGASAEGVFAWLDVSAFAGGEVPRVLRAFLDSFPHAELWCLQSGYIGPYLGLRGSRRAFPEDPVRDLDSWCLVGARPELSAAFADCGATSLIGTRVLGRIAAVAEDQPLPEPPVLRDLAARLAPILPAMAGFLEGLAVHAAAQVTAVRGMEIGLDRVEIPAAELAAYLRAGACEPDSRMLVSHCLYVCDLLLSKKEYDLLRDFAQPWSELNPTEPRFLYYVGRVGADLRDFALAVVPLEHAIALDPAYTPALDTLATVRGELGEWDRAVQLLERVRELDPARKGLMKRLGIANLRRGDHAAARHYLEQARQLNADDPEVLKALHDAGG